ncbi:cytochrome P450 [Podospora australis]|uniref:Cytochrome P450 n=1 Tax=Podospora australis TaxID=1536484 RepID=A0AAN6WM18_9PEZI|nr:cytochrome P450 [Podospora australis]
MSTANDTVSMPGAWWSPQSHSGSLGLVFARTVSATLLIVFTTYFWTVIPYVPYKWPLALDLLKRQYEILFSERTFEGLTPYFNIAGTACIHLFGATGYFTTDPDNIEAILSTKFEDYTLGNGHPWKKSRELIRRQFVRVYQQSPQDFTQHVDELLSRISEETVDGVVDLKPLMFEYTLNTTTMLLFGEPHSSMNREERDAVRDNFDYAAFGCGIRVRLADAAFLYNPSKYMDEYGEEAAAEKYAFIVDLWKEMQDSNLVREQLLHVLVAGRDSTAALLSWTFFHLVRNPDVLAKLQKEISSVPTDAKITREEIKKLTYLRCCLNESNPTLIPHTPYEPPLHQKSYSPAYGWRSRQKSPVLLPKGAGIAFSLYHLHRSEEIYGPDSRKFRPERWESGELIKKARPGAGYVDFNGGPRLCLRKDFALMEASYAVIRVLQAYPKIHLTPGVKNEPVGAERQTYTIGLSPTEGVLVSLT